MKWVHVLIFSSLLLSSPKIQAEGCASVGRTLDQILSDAMDGQKIDTQNPKTLDELVHAFENGAEPNLQDPFQLAGFKIYLTSRLGVPESTADHVLEIMAKYTKGIDLTPAEKISIRSQVLNFQKVTYGKSPELDTLFKTTLSKGNEFKKSITDPVSNQGIWKKILGHPNPANPTQDFHQSLIALFPEFEEALQKGRNIGPDILMSSLKKRSLGLEDELKAMKAQGASAEEMKRLQGMQLATDEALLNLVYYSGLENPKIAAMFKGLTSNEKFVALQSFLEAQDKTLSKLFPDKNPPLNFMDWGNSLKHLGGKRSDKVGLKSKIEELRITVASEVIDSGDFTLRQLSFHESPFRGCLGGDCSTDNYALWALQPQNLYFTTHFGTGRPVGQVSVVLGSADIGGSSTKVAYVDKFQGYSVNDIEPVLEGLRKAMEEKGYKLVIPLNAGDHNDLSNTDSLRLAFDQLAEKTTASQGSLFPGEGRSLQLLPNAPSGKNNYSTAYKGNIVVPVPPLDKNLIVKVTPGVVKEKSSVGKIDIDEIYQGILKLKNGTIADKESYLSTLETILKINDFKLNYKYKPRAEALQQAQLWLKDPNLSIKFKNQVGLFLNRNKLTSVDKIVENFSDSDTLNFINLLYDVKTPVDILDPSFTRVFNRLNNGAMKNGFEKYLARDYPGYDDPDTIEFFKIILADTKSEPTVRREIWNDLGGSVLFYRRTMIDNPSLGTWSRFFTSNLTEGKSDALLVKLMNQAVNRILKDNPPNSKALQDYLAGISKVPESSSDSKMAKRLYQLILERAQELSKK